jgi:hypothetical protein
MLSRHTASIVREGEHKNMARLSIVTLLVAITSWAVMYVDANLSVEKQLELRNGNLVRKTIKHFLSQHYFFFTNQNIRSNYKKCLKSR